MIALLFKSGTPNRYAELKQRSGEYQKKVISLGNA